MKLAGAPRIPFTPEAIQAIHRFSLGTPRVINTICDNALYEAFLLRQADIDGQFVARVAGDLGIDIPEVPQETEARSARPPSIVPGLTPAAPAPPAPMDLSDIDRYLESLSK